jgi:transposase
VGGGGRGEEKGGPGGRRRLTSCGQVEVRGERPVNNEWGEKERKGMEYSTTFKRAMVKKLAGPDQRTATTLAKETGVSQSTLSRWLREAGSVPVMSENKNTTEAQEFLRKRRPEDWSAEEKLQAVIEAASLSNEDLGAFFRRKGLHEAQLIAWREAAMTALGSPSVKGSKGEAKRVRELERELQRKDKALAETAALLMLQKKVRAIWGDEDDDTEARHGK